MQSMRLFEQKQAEDHPLVLVDIPTPEIKTGQVLLKIQLCGVCHTDLHTVEGDIYPPHLPVIPGHQVVARVEKVGQLLDSWPNERPVPQEGQRVGVTWLFSSCDDCDFCERGLENLCPDARFTGFDVDGGYAEYMAADSRYILPLPDEISDEQAAPLLCAGIIGYRSLHQADLQPGERLGLVGFGASAHLTIQVARHWGCEVYVFTRSEGHRKHAEELGAVWTGSIDDNPGVQLDRAVIFAPAGPLVPKTLGKLRPAGTLAINAVHMSNIPEMPYDLIYGERTLRSVANLTYQDGLEFLNLAVEIPLRSTTNLYPLDQANQALIDLKHSRLNGEAVLMV
jgi:propanol-preferring alcohol dehydrogenase